MHAFDAGSQGTHPSLPGSDAKLSPHSSGDLAGGGSLPSLPHALALLRRSDFSIDRDAAGAPCVLGDGSFGTVGGWVGGWAGG